MSTSYFNYPCHPVDFLAESQILDSESKMLRIKLIGELNNYQTDEVKKAFEDDEWNPTLFKNFKVQYDPQDNYIIGYFLFGFGENLPNTKYVTDLTEWEWTNWTVKL
jgi:hypothetical protein